MTNTTELLNRLAQVVSELHEVKGLDDVKRDLERQISAMKTELSALTVKHGEAVARLKGVDEQRLALIEATHGEQRKLDTVKAELKSFFAFGKAA